MCSNWEGSWDQGRVFSQIKDLTVLFVSWHTRSGREEEIDDESGKLIDLVFLSILFVFSVK